MNFLVTLGLIIGGVIAIDLVGFLVAIIQAKYYQDKDKH